MELNFGIHVLQQISREFNFTVEKIEMEKMEIKFPWSVFWK